MGTTRPLHATAVIVLSLFIGGVLGYDVWMDFFVKNYPWYLVLAEILPLLVLDGALFVLGWRLRRRGDHQIARRTLLGAVGGSIFVVTIGGYAYTIQSLQGMVDPFDLAVHVGPAAALIGAGAGFYSGRQQKLKEDLERERRQFSALFENTSDAVMQVRIESGEPIIEAVNSGFEQTFGYDADEVVGESSLILAPDEKVEKMQEHVEQVLAGERPDTTVTRETADGTKKTFRGKVIPIETSDEETLVYVTYTDISTQLQYASRLAALDEYAEALMNLSSEEEVIQRTLDALETDLGYDYVGIHSVADDDSTLEPRAVADAVKRLADGDVPAFDVADSPAGTVYRTQRPLRVDDVSEFDQVPVAAESTLEGALIYPLGEDSVLLVGGPDENAVDEYDRQVLDTVVTLYEAGVERAERERMIRAQNERLNRFADVLAHDIRNPLQAAKGYLTLAREGDEEAFDRVEDALDRIGELIDELLMLARDETVSEDASPVALDDVVENAWRLVDVKDATLETRGLGRIAGNKSQLQELFENLFRNAVEHGGEDITVRVGMLSEEDGFYVEDTGSGIPPGVRESIFEPGKTGQSSGTGLGLMIVEQIVDAHGGDVDVTESAEGGARFEIVLPSRRVE